MPQTAELPKIEIRQVCPGCGRCMPLDEYHMKFCTRCKKILCSDKCMRTCSCGVSRCYLCLQEIHGNMYGSACETCVEALNREERR